MLKFFAVYFRIESVLKILPNQGSIELYGKNIYDLNLRFEEDGELGEIIKKHPKNIFLIEVSTDFKILHTITPISETILNEKFLENIILENTNILNSIKNNKKINKVEIPKDTVFLNTNTWNLLVSAVQLKKYPLLIGPKGTGKTMTCKTIAKALQMDYYKLNCGSLFKPTKSLIGTIQAKEGSTYLVPSEFLKFYTSEKPTLIMLDELNRIPTMAANYMMNILEQEDSYIYSEEEGKRYYKGKDVTFIAACNFGLEYVDTRSLDGAFADRFIKVMIDYLPQDEEVKLICERLKDVEEKDVYGLVRKANIIREQVEEEVFQTGVSTRQLLDMCSFLTLGFTEYEITKYLFRNIFITSNSKEEIETFDKIINSES